jgi:serine/threonine protein kinase
LGRGAHALVKSGVDFSKQRKVAVKIYEKRELTSEDMKNIDKEVEILGILNHPCIIKLYEIIETIKTVKIALDRSISSWNTAEATHSNSIYAIALPVASRRQKQGSFLKRSSPPWSSCTAKA